MKLLKILKQLTSDKQTDIFTFNGDTLVVELKNVHKYIYIKRHIDTKLFDHNADW